MDKKHISSIKNGCTVSYEIFFREEYNALYLYCLRLIQDSEVAKELVSDSFLQLWSKRETIDETSNSLRPFIFRIAHNKSINYLKRQKEVATVSLDDFVYESELFADSNCNSLYTEELEQAIKEAIKKMPTQRRKIFEMSRYLQMTYNDIALELGISRKTVENQISRALSFLRLELKDYQ